MPELQYYLSCAVSMCVFYPSTRIDHCSGAAVDGWVVFLGHRKFRCRSHSVVPSDAQRNHALVRVTYALLRSPTKSTRTYCYFLTYPIGRSRAEAEVLSYLTILAHATVVRRKLCFRISMRICKRCSTGQWICSKGNKFGPSVPMTHLSLSIS